MAAGNRTDSGAWCESSVMNVVINLGDPAKDYTSLARDLLQIKTSGRCKLTGVRWSAAESTAITSPAYGAAMVVDTLTEFVHDGFLGADSSVILVGSMGSLSSRIALEDVVMPNPCKCAYYGFQNQTVSQDPELERLLIAELRRSAIAVKEYIHGSSYAVFDRHLDHATYRSAVYDNTVEGVDCGEVFLGLELSHRLGIPAAAVVYCSDSPSKKISDIGWAEFSARAADMDRALNAAAVSAFGRLRS